MIICLLVSKWLSEAIKRPTVQNLHFFTLQYGTEKFKKQKLLMWSTWTTRSWSFHPDTGSHYLLRAHNSLIIKHATYEWLKYELLSWKVCQWHLWVAPSQVPALPQPCKDTIKAQDPSPGLMVSTVEVQSCSDCVCLMWSLTSGSLRKETKVNSLKLKDAAIAGWLKV